MFRRNFLLLLVLAATIKASDFEIIWEQPIVGTAGQGVALGDVDGDGDLDALFTYDLSESLLFLNNGNGDLQPAEPAAGISGGSKASFADLDGDGDLDLFLARHLAACEVWLNDGAGAFSNSGQALGPSESRRSLKLADLDGDGDLDAIVPSESSSGANRLFFNDGAGSFTEGAETLGSTATRGVDAGDVDGDGDLDLIFGVNGRSKLWLGAGDGTFTESPQTFSVSGTFGVAFGDLDGDGDLDIYFANGVNSIPSEGSEVWFNDGSGSFTNSGQTIGEEYTFDVVLSDVDDDGDLDAIEGTNSTMPNKLWLNDGVGTFSDSGFSLGRARIPGLAAGDLTGDGRADYALAANLDPSEIWYGVDAANLVADSGQRLSGSAATCVAAGDMDGDGDLDVALGAIGGNVQLLANDGTGQFHSTQPALPNGFGNNNGDLAFGDFNGDGDLDLVVTNSRNSSTADHQTRLWVNDGTGAFSLGGTLFSDSPSEAVAVADLDDDNDLDLIIGSQRYGVYSGQNHIYLNDGSGSFTRVDTLGTGYVFEILPEDFDGDGDPDLFLALNNEPNELWLNDGAGNFTNSGQALGSSRTLAAAAADVDGDGDLDVVCGNLNQANTLWLNDGSGAFAQGGVSLGSGDTKAVRFIDANGDAHPDLWIGNGSNGASPDWIYENDGTGQFTLVQTLESRATSAMVYRDFSGDDRADMFTVSSQGNHALWSLPQTGADIAAYATSFGLAGDDTLPGEDPDADGLPNYAEMAFNLNPNSPDADLFSDQLSAERGQPALRVTQDAGELILEALVIRRRDAPNIHYALKTAPTLSGFVEPTLITVTTSEIDEAYELATYTFTIPAGSARYFGLVEVDLVEP